MRAQAAEHAFESFGVTEQSTFKIKASGKAFRVLIDGLYSDKIGSIVREVSTNAFDAHLAIGQEKPFFVHAPDGHIPEFYVRDYGIGMDHNKVLNIYSTMFESDKDQSDDLVGMLGLGSKSPFAYTDQFYVHAYDGPRDGYPGSVRNYIAAIGPDGVPQILYHGEIESDEPTGIKVGFAVDQKDFHKFGTAITNVAFGFEPAFETNVKSAKSVVEVTPALQGTGWRAFSATDFPNSYSYNRFFVRQGCVIYPVTRQDNLPVPECNRFRYLLEMPIGTVGVTASREAVEYNDHTISNIRARLKIVEEEIVEDIRNKTKNIQTVEHYFRAVTAIRPSWVVEQFRHPGTGLLSADYKFADRRGIFTASATEDGSDRWTYTFSNSIKCVDSDATIYYLISDISALLDDPTTVSLTEAPSNGSLSASERRRFARLCRHYATTNGLKTAAFGLALNWSEDFWSRCLPRAQIVEITVQDLKNAVPKRPRRAQRDPALPAPIRGLALAKAQGDQDVVSELPSSVDGCCWVEADAWRRNCAQIWSLSRRLGLKKVYIASAGVRELVGQSGMTTFKEAVTSVIKSRGLTPANLLSEQAHVDYYTQHGFDLAKRLIKEDRPLYERAARAKGMFSDILKAYKALVIFNVDVLGGKALNETERAALKTLFAPKPEQEAKPDPFDDKLKSVKHLAYGNQKHFVYKLIRVADEQPEDDILGLVETLLVAQRRFPTYKPGQESRYY